MCSPIVNSQTVSTLSENVFPDLLNKMKQRKSDKLTPKRKNTAGELEQVQVSYFKSVPVNRL